MGFSPHRGDMFPDKREICQMSRLSGQKCGNTAHKTVKISNFGHKFAPPGATGLHFLTKFSAFVRVDR